MAESRNFRSALNGFNREDVVRYIETMNNKHTALVNQLKSEKQSLADELAALKAAPAEETVSAAEYASLLQERDELLARLRAALRINRLNQQAAAPASVFRLDNMVIDYDRRQVSVDNQLIHTTQTEFNVLSYLSQHAGKVMTYSAIINAIWGTLDDGSIKKLQVNMANIRKKLGSRPGDNRYIINELGVGYRMQEE